MTTNGNRNFKRKIHNVIKYERLAYFSSKNKILYVLMFILFVFSISGICLCFFQIEDIFSSYRLFAAEFYKKIYNLHWLFSYIVLCYFYSIFLIKLYNADFYYSRPLYKNFILIIIVVAFNSFVGTILHNDSLVAVHYFNYFASLIKIIYPNDWEEKCIWFFEKSIYDPINQALVSPILIIHMFFCFLFFLLIIRHSILVIKENKKSLKNLLLEHGSYDKVYFLVAKKIITPSIIIIIINLFVVFWYFNNHDNLLNDHTLLQNKLNSDSSNVFIVPEFIYWPFLSLLDKFQSLEGYLTLLIFIIFLYFLPPQLENIFFFNIRSSKIFFFLWTISIIGVSFFYGHSLEYSFYYYNFFFYMHTFSYWFAYALPYHIYSKIKK